MKKIISLVAIILVAALAIGTLAGCGLFEKPQSKQLIAKWADSTNLGGYEFHEDGTVKITIANFTIPIINKVFDGTIDGAYTTTESEDGETNYVTIIYTLPIVNTSVEDTYTYVVEDSVLTMVHTESGNKVVYIKQTAETTTTTTTTTAA